MNTLFVIALMVGIASPLLFLRHIYYSKKCTFKVAATIESIEVSDIGKYKAPLIFPVYRYKVEHYWYSARSKVEYPFLGKRPDLKVGDKKMIWVCKSDHKFCIPAEYKNIKNGPFDLLFGIIGITLCLLLIVLDIL